MTLSIREHDPNRLWILLREKWQKNPGDFLKGSQPISRLSDVETYRAGKLNTEISL